MKKHIILSSVVAVVLSGALQGFGLFEPDLNEQVEYNTQKIKQYEQTIKELKKQNEYLKKEKAKHPQLYVKKPLYEETKKAYIFRVKLNGAKPDAVDFTVKDNEVFVSMNVKTEQKSDTGYYFSSRHFSQGYSIPKDVKQDKIKHSVEGDYFTITMPKK